MAIDAPAPRTDIGANPAAILPNSCQLSISFSAPLFHVDSSNAPRYSSPISVRKPSNPASARMPSASRLPRASVTLLTDVLRYLPTLVASAAAPRVLLIVLPATPRSGVNACSDHTSLYASLIAGRIAVPYVYFRLPSSLRAVRFSAYPLYIPVWRSVIGIAATAGSAIA